MEHIAILHANSWRLTYRGLFADKFLDNDADSERRNVWRIRLTRSQPEQFVCVAHEGGKKAGFVCAYGREDDIWGSLIDDLHVSPEYQNRGVGTLLMKNTFSWLHENFPTDSIYLWVMKGNDRARNFYEKIGASNAGNVDKPNPVGGGSAVNCRYVWTEETSIAQLR